MLDLADNGYLEDTPLRHLYFKLCPLHWLDLTACSRISWDALSYLSREGILDELRCLRLSWCDRLREPMDAYAIEGMCRVLFSARLLELRVDGCRMPFDVVHNMAACSSLQRLSMVRCVMWVNAHVWAPITG